MVAQTEQMPSDNLNSLTHSRLDVDGLKVMPSFLEEGSKEVESHHDVDLELFIRHVDVSNSASHASNLLELELDRGTSILNFLGKRLGVGHDKRESVNSVENWTSDGWHLLQDGV